MWPFWKARPDIEIHPEHKKKILAFVAASFSRWEERQIFADWISYFDSEMERQVRQPINHCALINCLNWGNWEAKDLYRSICGRVREKASVLSRFRQLPGWQSEQTELDDICGLVSIQEEVAFARIRDTAVYPARQTLNRVIRSSKHCNRLCWAWLSGIDVPGDVNLVMVPCLEVIRSRFLVPWIQDRITPARQREYDGDDIIF